MPPPSKVKKTKPVKKPTHSSSEASHSNSQPTVDSSGPTPLELREKAKSEGKRLRELFWSNLRSVPSDLPSKSDFLQGLKLLSEEVALQKLSEAERLFSSNNFSDCISLLSSVIEEAPLDENILCSLFLLRGKCYFETKRYMEAVRDFTFAIEFDKTNASLFWRMKCYIELQLYIYATLDYDRLAEEFPDTENLKSFKNQVTRPLPNQLQQLLKKIPSSSGLPSQTSLQDAVHATICAALIQDWDFEQLGSWIVTLKQKKLKCIQSASDFGLFLRDTFAATSMEDISEVFTHIIPEQEIPMEFAINEVIETLQSMSKATHITQQIGYALCFSLAWTPSSFWNLYSTLFPKHVESRFEYQQALWREYYNIEMDRIRFGDDDFSYTVNEGIGEIPPIHSGIGYVYYADHGASDFIRLHAVATAHGKKEVLEELEQRCPINPFYVTGAPILFATVRDAMPLSTKFILERGAHVNIVDAAEESPLDACRIAKGFREDVLANTDIPKNTELYDQTEEILVAAGAQSNNGNSNQQRQSGGLFEQMFGGGQGGFDGEEEGEYDDDEGDYEDYLHDDEYPEEDFDGEEEDEDEDEEDEE